MPLDIALMKGVFYNLLENAAQAAQQAGRRPGRIWIRAERHPERPKMVRVSLTDNGPGVARDHLERIFEPYFTTKSAGTCLGLAVVRKTILEHRGTIRAESEPGRGATFIIELPTAE